MRYHALVCDYDGTLAEGGRMSDETREALQRLKATGRRLLLVTGRELGDLQRVCPDLTAFDRVVAENGAVLYEPESRELKLLAEPPPQEFVEALRAARVSPLALGHVIVATWSPYEKAVLEAIRSLGLELQVIFNKGAVMVLPTGVNKATGLQAALDQLGLSAHETVGVGDAENDHAFLALCECAVAVANAIPVLQERADLVTAGHHGSGVVELVERMLTSDLAELEPRLARHAVPLGTAGDGSRVHIEPYGVSLLLAGTSGSGKSTLAAGFLERLAEAGYQFCIVDPEGDYPAFPEAVVLGDKDRSPGPDEVLELLARPTRNAVVNLLGIPLEDRPGFFEKLLPRLQSLRARTGRPHWIVVDETHHLLPASWDPASLLLPQELHGLMLITVHPDQVSRAVLSLVDLIVAVGSEPDETLAVFARTLDQPPPRVTRRELASGEAIGWWRRGGGEAFWFRSIPPQSERRRHLRKYAEGDVGEDRSFYFRGPQQKLNLRARNLATFLQLAFGVDDETWLHHLRRRDYSRWFREVIKDEALAAEAEAVETAAGLGADESRRRIREAIEERYTAPA
jgi:HAD superfamily hydrolase (TIGR01484 family)